MRMRHNVPWQSSKSSKSKIQKVPQSLPQESLHVVPGVSQFLIIISKFVSFKPGGDAVGQASVKNSSMARNMNAAAKWVRPWHDLTMPLLNHFVIQFLCYHLAKASTAHHNRAPSSAFKQENEQRNRWNAASITACNDDQLTINWYHIDSIADRIVLFRTACQMMPTQTWLQHAISPPELQFEWCHVQLSSHPRRGGAVESGPIEA